jgi:hypothetical protein
MRPDLYSEDRLARGRLLSSRFPALGQALISEPTVEMSPENQKLLQTGKDVLKST